MPCLKGGRHAAVLASLLLLLGAAVRANEGTSLNPPSVITDQGEVLGAHEGGLRVFRGIPYAAPPVGEYRWRPPRPPLNRSDPFLAHEFGSWCPQLLRPNYSEGVLDPAHMSEDCLTLNIWAPPVADNLSPVMVWINPGSFRQGSAQLPRYDGTALAQQGVVLVTFEYRLGLLGQFAHPQMTREQSTEPLGNYGLMDQIALLRWVRENIAGFGGDPDNVTIFGMSAGGVSANYLMTVPETQDLFHRVISQSSGIRISAPLHRSRALGHIPSLESAGTSLATYFGISGDDPTTQLRDLSVDDLLDYQKDPKLYPPGSSNPVVDGVLVKEAVGVVFRENRQHAVPYLAGATSWEGSLVAFLPGPEALMPVFGLEPQSLERLYGDLDPRAQVNAIETDFFYGSQRYLAHAHAQGGNPAWLYFFDRVLEAHQDEYPGAAHGAETRYVFQTLDSLNRVPQPGYGHEITASDRKYAQQLSQIWVAFARDGRPPRSMAWSTASSPEAAVMVFGQDGWSLNEAFRLQRLAHYHELFQSGKL